MAVQLATGTFLGACLAGLAVLIGLVNIREMIIGVVGLILAVPFIVWFDRQFLGGQGLAAVSHSSDRLDLASDWHALEGRG
jgi:hypothetical protein